MKNNKSDEFELKERLNSETSETESTTKSGNKRKSKSTDTVSVIKLFRYSTSWDLLLLILGAIVSLLTGAGWPLMSIIFGGLSNTFLAGQNSYQSSWNANMTSTELVDSLEAIGKQQFLDGTTQYCLQFVYLGIAVFIAGYLQMAIWITCCERQIQRVRREFFYALLRQDIAWFDRKQSGQLTAQLADNIERLREGIGDKFGLMIQYFAQFFAGFIVAFMYSWKLTLVMMSMTPLLAISSGFMAKLIGQAAKREQNKYAKAGAIAEEVLSCIRTVVAFNGQNRESVRYEAALMEGRKDGMMKSLYNGLGMGLVFLIMFSSYGLAFWFGSTLIASGDIARGTVFTVFFSVMTGSFALGSAGPSIALVATAKGAAAEVFEVIDRKPPIDSYGLTGKKLTTTEGGPKGNLELKHVSFSYPTRKQVQVLTDVNLRVEAGEKVALVGSSGCGKSTIVNLLLRYYDPTQGKILLDGTELTSLNLKWLRNTIGVVSQEPVLFDASVEENIRLGRDDVTHSELITACKMANAHDFISRLPDGYKTMVGERGTQMSGGQKQRVAIARALVRDPKILLLDEATSALDSESEGVVQEALDKAQSGRTTIIVAHRLSTIRSADKIIALENGRIVEQGTHVELMNAKGVYHALVTAQVFVEPASGYASGDTDDEEEDGVDQGFQDNHDVVTPRRSQDGSATGSQTEVKARARSNASSRKGKSMSRQSSRVSWTTRSETSSLVSAVESSASRRRTLLARSLSKAETERERLEHELREEGAKKASFKQILLESKGDWVYIFLALVGGIVRGAVMPAFAFFYGEIFNTFSKSGTDLTEGTVLWSLMFVMLGIIEAVTWIMSAYFFGLSGENLTIRMRMKVFRNILRQDIAFFDDTRHSTGKICTRLATDAPNVKNALDFRLANVFSAFVSMVGGIAIGFFFGWKLALLVLALFPLVGFGGYIRLRLREGGAKKDSQMFEEAGKVAVDAIENIRTVQALTKEQTFFDKFADLLAKPHKEALKQAQIQGVSYGFSQSIFFFMYGACFAFGAYLVGLDQMSPLQVYRVFFAITFSGMAVGWATAYFPEYLKARFSAGLIFKMANITPTIDSNSTSGLKPDLTGQVGLSSVRFCYPSRPDAPVLRGLTLTVQSGQTLALVGPSGCGKSTVVSLLERFYDPQHGNLQLDELPLKTLNVGHVRDRMSLVSQEPVLFDCSITENILYGLEELGIDDERVKEAARKANIHDFIRGLPEGYETRVGEKGTQLSGGQKQRIAIARALVRNPKILLLDEATSALDTESEKVVQEALDRARQGRTCIVIAHRLSTVQSADSIAVIKRGRIVEQGTHQELIAKKGAYFNLTRKQNLAS